LQPQILLFRKLGFGSSCNGRSFCKEIKSVKSEAENLSEAGKIIHSNFKP